MTALAPFLGYIKLAGIVALVILTWWLAGEHYKGIALKDQVSRDKASAALIAKKDAQIKEGDTQHGQDQVLINNLTGELARANRMPIHIPTRCDGNTEGGSDTDGGSGIFSEAIDSALAEVREEDGRDSQRCDQINIDAIRSNTANR